METYSIVWKGHEKIENRTMETTTYLPNIILIKSQLHQQQGSCHRKLEMVLSCRDSLHLNAAFCGDRKI